MIPDQTGPKTSKLRNAAGGLAALVVFCLPAVAQEVTITSRQGNLTLTGRIAGFDGTYLELESAYGPLTMAYDGVTCSGSACPDPGNWVPHLRLSGEPLLSQILVPALLEGFARDRDLTLETRETDAGELALALAGTDGKPALHITLEALQTAEAFADLVSFETDVALVFRTLSKPEAALAAEVGINLTEGTSRNVILGSDALVAITSPLNPALTIDPKAVIAAFNGQIDDWSDLGQTAQPLTLHLGPDGDGHAEAFLALLPKSPAVSVTRHADADHLAAAVAADAGALGITSLAATGVAQPLGLRDSCDLNAIPRPAGIKTQDYPLTTPALAYVRSSRQPQIVSDLLKWIRSPAAQLIARRAGLVDQGVMPIPLDDQGERLAHAITIAGADTSLPDLQRMVAMMHARARLSLTFRFANGTTDLDTVSAANLRVLAQDIRDGAFDGREVMLMGFSDGEGAAAANRELSLARADAVKAALVNRLTQLPADVRIETAGFGEALPIGCDTTSWGRRMNRRVEVWVGD